MRCWNTKWAALVAAPSPVVYGAKKDMTYQDSMRCPSHQPLHSNWIGLYWLRRFCSGLWDHLRRVIFSRAFLSSTILLCKKRWEEGMKHAQGKTWKHVVARNSQLDFLVTFTTFTSRSYRAGTLATGVACDPAGTYWTSRVLKIISSKWFAVTAAWMALAP